jgi:hypothetical protein
MAKTANQVEIENSHIQSQQLAKASVTSILKNLNRTVVIANCKLKRPVLPEFAICNLQFAIPPVTLEAPGVTGLALWSNIA